jgi:hypothetical protein
MLSKTIYWWYPFTMLKTIRINFALFRCWWYNSSFKTYHPDCYWSSTMCISSGTGTAYSFGVHEITSDFHGGSCFSTFSFLCSALEIVRFPFFLFLFAIVSSVLLRFTDSSYPFDILKLFFKIKGSFELNIGGFQKLQLT